MERLQINNIQDIQQNAKSLDIQVNNKNKNPVELSAFYYLALAMQKGLNNNEACQKKHTLDDYIKANLEQELSSSSTDLQKRLDFLKNLQEEFSKNSDLSIWITGLYDQFKGYQDAINDAVAKMKDALDKLQHPNLKWYEKVLNWFEKAIDVFNKTKNRLEQQIHDLENQIATVLQKGKNLSAKDLEGLSQNFQDLAQILQRLVHSMFYGLLGAFSKPSEFINNPVSEIKKGNTLKGIGEYFAELFIVLMAPMITLSLVAMFLIPQSVTSKVNNFLINKPVNKISSGKVTDVFEGIFQFVLEVVAIVAIVYVLKTAASKFMGEAAEKGTEDTLAKETESIAQKTTENFVQQAAKTALDAAKLITKMTIEAITLLTMFPQLNLDGNTKKIQDAMALSQSAALESQVATTYGAASQDIVSKQAAEERLILQKINSQIQDLIGLLKQSESVSDVILTGNNIAPYKS